MKPTSCSIAGFIGLSMIILILAAGFVENKQDGKLFKTIFITVHVHLTPKNIGC